MRPQLLLWSRAIRRPDIVFFLSCVPSIFLVTASLLFHIAAPLPMYCTSGIQLPISRVIPHPPGSEASTAIVLPYLTSRMYSSELSTRTFILRVSPLRVSHSHLSASECAVFSNLKLVFTKGNLHWGTHPTSGHGCEHELSFHKYSPHTPLIPCASPRHLTTASPWPHLLPPPSRRTSPKNCSTPSTLLPNLSVLPPATIHRTMSSPSAPPTAPAGRCSWCGTAVPSVCSTDCKYPLPMFVHACWTPNIF